MEKNEIMIVEDDLDLGLILQLHLQGNGFKTIFLQSISETTTYLTYEQPTLLLVDNHLTDGTALDHIGEFKTSTPDLSIVLMTADFLEELQNHQNYGYLDGLLLKPFAPEILNQVLQHAISTKRF
jgi:response regulator of citrate/malate metabolism